MTARVVLKTASRARWLNARRRGITATDVPAILGLSPWATPLKIWLDKVDPQPREPSYLMLRGLALERALAAEYARTTGATVERAPALLAHPDHPWLMCSLDRFAHHDTGTVNLELKTDHEWRDWVDNDLPDMYAAQALTQSAITGYPTVVFADVNSRLEVRRIERDLAWEAEVIPLLAEWRQRHMIDMEPPPLDPYRDYVLLNRVWRADPAVTVDADDAVMGAVKAYAALRERAKERERTMTGLKTQIRAHMGSAGVLLHHETGYKVAAVDSRGALLVTYQPTTEEGITP